MRYAFENKHVGLVWKESASISHLVYMYFHVSFFFALKDCCLKGSLGVASPLFHQNSWREKCIYSCTLYKTHELFTWESNFYFNELYRLLKTIDALQDDRRLFLRDESYLWVVESCIVLHNKWSVRTTVSKVSFLQWLHWLSRAEKKHDNWYTFLQYATELSAVQWHMYCLAQIVWVFLQHIYLLLN